MQLPARRPAGRRERRAARMAGVCTLALALAAMVWPTAVAGSAALATARQSQAAMARNPAIGAMFTSSGGQPPEHFCTASVVDSQAGDLLVTAAHCVRGFSDTSPADLTFVPGFDNDSAPYGIWTVTRIFVDSAWSASADPDHDVAFLRVQQPGSSTQIQDITGGERLGATQPPAGPVRVTGYPDTQNQPISCQNRVRAFGSGQLRFDCPHYTDGTSGSPFMIDLDPATGEGTVIGVLGGYQQGGDSPDVSYAAAFGPDVQSLYDAAASGT